MSDPLFSALWYRVAKLRPQLASHARIHRHRYRGRVWYVLEDAASQRFHRFAPAVHALIGLMDGERTIDDIWRISAALLGDDAPTQDEMIRLLAQLHGAGVLRTSATPDAGELLERLTQQKRRQWQSRLLSPLSIRIPLFDPERVLTRLEPLARPLAGILGLAVWALAVLPALALAGVFWTDLTEGFTDRVFSAQNLLLVWLLFPVLKLLHEFGHGLATKIYGGEVHDMGVMLLVLTPVPYVDASAASAFPEKGRRALVGAAGMAVETFVAALAFYVWLAAEPGSVRTLAYNTFLIGGLTTLAFNANPLLRFDGYYILADLIEVPNLWVRAHRYLGYLAERYALGRREAEAPDASVGERAWLASYAVGAFLYRLVITAAILMFVLEISVPLGVALAVVSLVGWVGVPVGKGLRYLLVDPRLRKVRARAIATVGASAAALVMLTGFLPVPDRLRTEGVVWLPDEAFVRARTSGFVERVVAQSGSRVAAGDVLVESRDPDLEAELRVLESRLRGLRIHLVQERTRDRLRSGILGEEVVYLEQQLSRARERREDLFVLSPTAGVFVSPKAADLQGRFVRQGEELGHVLDLTRIRVRAVVPQADIHLVRESGERVDVRFAEHLGIVHDARVVRVVPTASEVLPSAALGDSGGGEAAIDPRDERGGRAVETYFQVELELPLETGLVNAGGRAYLRFDHGAAPLAAQWYRMIRRTFLSKLDV